MTVGAFLLVLAGTLACFGGAAVVAGWLVAQVLDERDRRRDSRTPAGIIGGRDRAAPRVLVLPDAGPPGPGVGVAVPDVRHGPVPTPTGH